MIAIEQAPKTQQLVQQFRVEPTNKMKSLDMQDYNLFDDPKYKDFEPS